MPDDLLARLVDQAALRFGEPARELAPGDDLFEKLGIDSLQALDLLTDLEEAFAIEIPDWEVQGVHTLAGLADVIRRRL